MIQIEPYYSKFGIMSGMDAKTKKKQVWFGVGVSLLCLAGIFFLIDPAEILKAMKMADPRYALLSAGGMLLFMLLRAVRWRFLLDNDASFMQIFHIQNIGYMLIMILPFRLGDVARAVLIGNVPSITISRGLSTMVVERLLDMLFFVILLPFTLAAVETLPPWMQSFAYVSGFISLTAVFFLIAAANLRTWVRGVITAVFTHISFLNSDTWVRRIDDLLAGLVVFTRLRDGLIIGALSMLVWLPILLAYYSGMRAVGLSPSAAMTGFVVSAAAFAVAAPSSPGQVGIFHATVIAALLFLGQPEVASATFAFGYHAVYTALMLILGGIGLTATGEAIGNVVASTRQFMHKKENNNKTWREWIFIGTMIALIGFVVLTTAAMFLYNGGNEYDLTAVNYSFTKNFFSDLGMSISYHGEPKLLVMLLFMLALGSVGVGLIGYSVAAPYLFRKTAVAHWAARIGSFFGIISGLAYIGVVATPSDLYLSAHKEFVFIAFSGFLVTAVFYFIATLLNQSYPNKYAYAYALFAIALFVYVLFILYGPDFGTQKGDGLQVIGQKLIVYISIFSMIFQVYGARQQLKLES